MKYKDMSQYRDGRKESRVAQTWLNDYKQMVVNEVVYRHSNPKSVSEEVLDAIYSGSPQTAEIVADTIIGWLNSPVGRQFIRDAFKINVSQVAEDGSW